MPLQSDSDAGRRLLVTAGTVHFEKLADSDLLKVPDELERITKAFCGLGYKLAQEAIIDPDRDTLWKLFAGIGRDAANGDLLVTYYTGHGARGPDRFYMLTRNSDRNDLSRTALAAEDLARALIEGSKASQLLVILDACYAAKGVEEMQEIKSSLTFALQGGPAVFLIAAAGMKQEAEQGVLSTALEKVLANHDERLGGLTQPLFFIDQIMGEIHKYLKDYPAQVATWSSSHVVGECRLFPNPRYRSEIPPDLDLDTQHAFEEHWIPKARGIGLGKGGYYFTGRRQALQELATWLSAECSDGLARVVTGAAGCGKSAVLARIVTLADPKYRREVLAASQSTMLDPATLPPEGVVSVAVHARHKLLGKMSEDIAAGLGLAAREPTDLLKAIERRSDKTVIVIDALDEANDREQIISQLLRRLAVLPQVFLLIGTRPDWSGHGRRFRALGESTVEIDLDRPRYIGIDDVANYVEKRLLASEEPNRPTPYRDSPEIAHTVAKAVAKRAHNVFLVAYTAVHTLIAEPSTVDTTEPGWIERLPTGLKDAFNLFLNTLDARRPDGLSAQKTRAVLLPLAFAEGAGLPWAGGLWATAATAISDSDLSDDIDADIALVRKHAAAFIIEATEHDRSVYRLYHESLAEILRASVPDAKKVQQHFVEVLRSLVPVSPIMQRPDWIRAHPYLLTHLVAHALKAGTLGELVDDGMFVACAEPLHMLEALSVSKESSIRGLYACYWLVFDRLRNQPVDVRVSYLDMAARQRGDHRLVEIWERIKLPHRWAVLWAYWSPVIPHRWLYMASPVTSVVLGKLDDGKQVIVSGGEDGIVRIWDFPEFTPRASPQRRPAFRICVLGMGERLQPAPVSSLVFGKLDDKAVLVSSWQQGYVQVWDPASGEPIGEPLCIKEGCMHSVVVLGTLNGRPMMVSDRSDNKIQLWDLSSGAPCWDLPDLFDKYRRVSSVAFGTLSDRQVMVLGASDGDITVWDLTSHEMLRRGQIIGPVTSVAIGKVGDNPVIIAAGEDCKVHVWKWELLSPVLRGETLRGHKRSVTSLALGMLDGKPVIVSGSCDCTVRLWDLAQGEPRREPLTLSGHENPVTSVAFGMLDSGPVIVSGGRDGSLRVWDLNLAEQSEKDLRRPPITLSSLALGTLNGEPVIVSGSEDGTVHLWDLASGAQHRELLRCHKGWVRTVAVGILDRRQVIVSGGEDGTVRLWDLVTGEPYGKPMVGHAPVTSLTSGTLNGELVIVSDSGNHTVRWDLASGTLHGSPMDNESWACSVVLGTLDGHQVIFSGGGDGVVRMWELVSGDPYGKPMVVGEDPVISLALGTLDRHTVLVSSSWDGTVRVWDLDAREARGEPLRGHKGWVRTVAVGILDGCEVIVSGGEDGTVRVWDAAGVEVSKVCVGSIVTAVALAAPADVVLASAQGLLLLRFEKGSIIRSARTEVGI